MANTPYSFVSVKKKSDNAGRPTGKAAYLLLFDWNDVKTYVRDAKGVKMAEFEFITGKKPIGIYRTPSTENVFNTSTGEEDGRGYIHNVDFDVPGTDLEVDEFFENNINKRLGAISLPCNGDARIAGTPDNPLFITQDNTEDSSKKHGHTVQMKSSLPGAILGYISKSLIPITDNADVNAILGLPASGSTGGGI